ncbi:2OG-Fe(II) oxygenase [Flavivirga sp. 57AJ16]|uniref:2OG-Fe(II) oxygenase n=1 Tax=Flavivirga sp. 57AJ16 TaxID=3025307 RepID=UPI002365CEFF|nr:2OG-Fe(II) oxygenase [Flavivirga sp. 57AJ16]MDD7887453.1 2OG-Fe(II) oxygenase [Flavivirga sp. 57AJ16]
MLRTYEKLIQGLLDKGFESVDNWLTDDELIGLRKSLLKHQENDHFHFAGIGNKENLQTLEKIRSDRIYWIDPSKANPWEEIFFKKINDYVDYLNRTCYTGIRSYEFQYAIYDIGSYYKKHIDTFKNDDKRQFSIVFYISDHWKQGDGGELKLYTNNAVTEIQPIPGKMVFFKSDMAHEVLKSNSKRLSITGWLKSN